MAAPMNKEALLSKFVKLGIHALTVEHPEVFTVEQALPHIDRMDGLFAKNLFLRDKKNSFWLFCAPHYANIKLNDLAKMVGAPGGLRFADEDNLYKMLGVKQGCVTVFGLINDREKKVKLIIDSRFWDEGEGEECKRNEGVTASADDITKAENDRIHTKEQDECETPTDGETRDVKCEQRIYFHPLVNSASTGVTVAELKRFLTYTGHKPIIVNFKMQLC